MCLAIPGKILEVEPNEHGVRMARASFGGIVKSVCLEYTPEADAGDYVLVHVGFALHRIDEAEAARTYEALRELGQLDEIEEPAKNEGKPVPRPPGPASRENPAPDSSTAAPP